MLFTALAYSVSNLRQQGLVSLYVSYNLSSRYTISHISRIGAGITISFEIDLKMRRPISLFAAMHPGNRAK